MDSTRPFQSTYPQAGTPLAPRIALKMALSVKWKHTSTVKMPYVFLYLLKSHLKETFHSSFDRQQFGGEGGVANTDGPVLFLIWRPIGSGKKRYENLTY